MLPTRYNSLVFGRVEDLTDFFKDTGLPEMSKVKGIYEASKLMLNLPTKKVMLEVAEGERVYKFTYFTPGIHNIPLGWAVYLPQIRQLDIYLPEDPYVPILQWKGKKVEFKNYPELYNRLGFDSLFNRITNLV